jgi:ProP effector
VRPLARGIHKAIVANAPDLPPSIVSQALAIYATWLPYMCACIVGAPRIDLSGDPAGVVTEKEAMYAVQRLAARERKCDEGRAEHEAAVKKAQEAGERPRQAAGRRARSVKGKAVTVRAVERVAAKTAKQAAAACQVTSAKGETTTRQDPTKAGPERLGLAGLKAAAQRRRLAASTS